MMIQAGKRRGKSTTSGTISPPEIPNPQPSAAIEYLSGIDMFRVTLPGVSEVLYVPNFTRAGYPGGIPSVAGVFIVTVSGFNKAAIDAAVSQGVQLSLANPGKYVVVFFPDGSYDYAGRIQIADVSNLVFRGQSKEGVVINFTNGSGAPYSGHFDVRGTLPGSVAVKDIGASAPRGSRVLKMVDNEDILSGKFRAGSYALLKQEYYPQRIDRMYSLWKPLGTPTSVNFINMLVKIESVNAATSEVTLQYPLPYDIDHTRRVRLIEQPNVCRNIGFENMTLSFANTTAHDGIYMARVDGGWINNVAFIKPYSFPFQFTECQHIEVANVYSEDAVNTGGNYNGYFGLVAVSHSLIRNSLVKNHRHLLFQSNAVGCVMVDVECQNMDTHYHADASMNCLMDRVVLGRGWYGSPWHLDGPTNENDIHRPEGWGNVMWNFDAWDCGKWNRSWKLFFSLENALFAYGRIRWGGYHRKDNGQPADRIPGVTVLGETGPVRFAHVNWGYDKEILKQHSLTDTQRASFEAAACFMDHVPGIIKEYNNNGTIQYGRQSGQNVYPALTAEPVFIPYRPEVPSNADVRLFSCSVSGLPENRLFFGHLGKGPVKNESFSSSPVFDPNTRISDRPDGLDSLFYAQKAYFAANLG